jgi:autotransporter-associated beta strand protein
MAIYRTHAVYMSVLVASIVFAHGIASASTITPHGAVAVRSLRGSEWWGGQGARLEGDPVSITQSGIWTGNTFQSSQAWASANAAENRFLQAAATATGVGTQLFVPAGEGQGVAVWRDIATTDASTKPSGLRLNFSLSSFLSAEKYPDTTNTRNQAQIGVDWESTGWWDYNGGSHSSYAVLAGKISQSNADTKLELVEGTAWDAFAKNRVQARWDSHSFSLVPDGSKYLFEGTFHINVPYSSEHSGYRWGLALSAYTFALGGEAKVHQPSIGMPSGIALESISNRDIGPPLRVYFDSGLLPMDVPGFVVLNVSSGTQTQAEAGQLTLSGSIPLAKTGTGTLVLTVANTLTGSATVHSGQLVLAHHAALEASRLVPLPGGKVGLAPGLQAMVGGLVPNAGGLTNVGSGLITVASGLSSVDVVAAIAAGRGDGSWSGTSGITSSAAASSDGSRTVGWMENDDGSVTFGYAAAGDANLDWQIDIIDIANVLGGGKVNSGLSATWAEGDFNYDGFADILDVADFISSGLFNDGPYNAPASTIAAVPEPSTCVMALAGLACGGYTMFRRRKRA